MPGCVEGRNSPTRQCNRIFKNTVISLCHETTIQSVSKTYDIPYTTLERWYNEWVESENARMANEWKRSA
ncbi:hypothetical protein ABHN01_24800, partial [Fictibacillus sp. NRS-1165]